MLKEWGNVKRYTSKEAAEIIGLSHGYFLKQLKAGKYPCHKTSARRFFFTDEDIQEMIDGCRVPAKESTIYDTEGK